MNTENMKGLASLGRNEDNYLAHVAAGEMVVPPVITPETRQRLEQEMMSVGLNPNEYKVGNGMSINPITGNPEFGFLKKIGKSLKKVVKKVAPIAAIGLGIAGIGGAGPLKGLLGKGAAKATTGKFFGAGGKFRSGLGGLFSPGGMFRRSPTDQGGTPQIIKSIGDYFGFGGRSAQLERLGYTAEEIAAMTDEEKAALINEASKSRSGILSMFGDGEGRPSGLGNLGIAGLAGLVGKLAYEDAKNFKGVPLTPLTTMDQLGRYNIAAEIARQKGEEMPSRVEYGLTGEGMPVLQGGGTGITPRSAAMGGIMAFADGGVVQMAKGGGASTFSEANVSSYIDTLKKKRQDVGNLYMKIPNKYDKQYDNATKNLQNAKTYLTTTNIAAYKDGGIDSLPSAQAKTEFKKFLNYLSTEKMQEGGELDINNFPPMDGDINGPGTETSDDIPAMLSDGEFVMTAKAVRGAGGFDMAKGGNGIVTLTPNGDPGRESGTRIMYKLMEHFGSVA